MLLFSVPGWEPVAVNLLAPPTYINSLGGLGSALARSAPEEIVVDFRPEGSWTWEGYTFSIHPGGGVVTWEMSRPSTTC